MVSACRNDDLGDPLARRVHDNALQQVAREASARLVEAMIEQMLWCDHMHARVALTIAARAIRRGRHLTDAERTENLAQALEEDVQPQTCARNEKAALTDWNQRPNED